MKFESRLRILPTGGHAAYPTTACRFKTPIPSRCCSSRRRASRIFRTSQPILRSVARHISRSSATKRTTVSRAITSPIFRPCSAALRSIWVTRTRPIFQRISVSSASTPPHLPPAHRARSIPIRRWQHSISSSAGTCHLLQPARLATGQSSGHLERASFPAVGKQNDHEHQPGDELLAGRIDESQRMHRAAVGSPSTILPSAATHSTEAISRPRLGTASQHRHPARHGAHQQHRRRLAHRRRVALLSPLGALPLHWRSHFLASARIRS